MLMRPKVAEVRSSSLFLSLSVLEGVGFVGFIFNTIKFS